MNLPRNLPREVGEGLNTGGMAVFSEYSILSSPVPHKVAWLLAPSGFFTGFLAISYDACFRDKTTGF